MRTHAHPNTHPSRHHRSRPVGTCCSVSSFTSMVSTTSFSNGKPANTCSAAFAPASSSKSRSICLTKPASAHACTPTGWCMKACRFAVDGVRHRISFKEMTGKAVMVYGQTEITKDLMEAARLSVHRQSMRHTMLLCTTSPAKSRASRSAPMGRNGSFCAISLPGATAFTASAARPCRRPRLPRMSGSIRSAGSAFCGYAAGFRRADLCSPRARLCALLDALADAQPLYIQCSLAEDIESWPDERFWEELKPRLDRGGARSPGDRAVDRKEHCAVAQLCRRADAVRPAFSGRRRRPYRAADRRQGIQSRRKRRALSVAGFHRALRRKVRRGARSTTPTARWRGCGKPSAFHGG